MPEKPSEVKEQQEQWVTAGSIEIVVPPKPQVEESLFLSGGQEAQEELDANLDKQAEREEDNLTASMVREMKATYEARLDKQERLISQLVAKVGALVLPKTPDADTEAYLNEQTRTLLAGKKTVKIVIATSDNPGLNVPVMVGLNGQNWELPRGQAVEVPVQLVEILSNARVEGTQMLVTPDGDRSTVRVNQLRFPFTIWS